MHRFQSWLIGRRLRVQHTPTHALSGRQIGAANEARKPLSFFDGSVRTPSVQLPVARQQIGPMLPQLLEEQAPDLPAEMERDSRHIRGPGLRCEFEDLRHLLG